MAKWLITTGVLTFNGLNDRGTPEIQTVEAEDFEIKTENIGTSTAPYVVKQLLFKDGAGKNIAYFSSFTSVRKAAE